MRLPRCASGTPSSSFIAAANLACVDALRDELLTRSLDIGDGEYAFTFCGGLLDGIAYIFLYHSIYNGHCI